MSIMLHEILEQPGVLAGIEDTNRAVLGKLVSRIKQSDIKLVVVAARGTSDHSGVYMKYLTEILLDVPVLLAAPSVNTMYGSKIMYRDALVVAVSQSGMAEDALAVLKDANAAGALTVAVTNNLHSPLAETAQYCLYCAAGPEYSVAATKTFTAEMFCIALLAAKWADDAELAGALRILPEGMAKETGKAEDIMQRAGNFVSMRQCVVLGRGLLYPIALEAALKMMETSYINARGFAISDFQHGPLALLGDHMPVFVLCASDETKEDVLHAAGEYAKMGALVTMVCDDAANAPDAKEAFIVEKSCKYTAPFHFAVFAQLFACGLAEARGLTPDTPRNIKKITITR